MSATARLSKPEPGSPSEGPFERILLASEGRPISDAAIARVVELAKASDASVRVFTIARDPRRLVRDAEPGAAADQGASGPSSATIVDKAVKRLERKGIDADGHVVGYPQDDQADPPGGRSSPAARRS